MTLSLRMAAFGLAAALTTASAHAETWDMPTPYPDSTFHTVNIRDFAKDVSDRTNGALQIEVHSAGSLFQHPQIKNAVRSGQVPIGEFFLSLISNEDAAYGLDSLPFLATNYDDAKRLWDAQKPVITELLAKQNLIPLFSVPWPPQGLYTRKEIATVDDLKGVKLRSYNPMLELFASLSGAVPVQVEVPDIPQAFTTGQVEAMITSPSTGVSSKAWDYVTYYTPINAWLPKNIVVVNRDAFRALPADQQQAVMEAAAAAETRGWQMSMAETDAQTKALADNGMTVVQPSDALIAGLKEIGQKMQQTWAEKASPEANKILADYEAMH
ncbi:MAG: C4-dicarboxylate ABC transporter substrate-binding protein [Limimaricola sp.]|uniref:TRAP transporter substrate-binding protein n=1 Tax=Limimaricola sp. TaxID=2211665 RepID=UPI001DDE6292|nr:TRAP transporter substrate-binding protein [Limimaricola sp.]MBI1417959.1 C4-dicarboxylate ABC transporter substrate-binding protein [Limimaricola sp.]